MSKDDAHNVKSAREIALEKAAKMSETPPESEQTSPEVAEIKEAQDAVLAKIEEMKEKMYAQMTPEEAARVKAELAEKRHRAQTPPPVEQAEAQQPDPSFLSLAHELIDEAGLGQLPDDFKKQQVNDLAGEMQRRVGLAIIAGMSDDQAESYVGFLQSSSPEKVPVYLDEHLPNWQKISATALTEFRSEYLAGAENLRKNT